MLDKLTKPFGSDVYIAYTANYTWQCNQTAHCMFGFAGATLVLTAAPRLGGNAWWGLFFIIVPFLKDMTDIVVDIARTTKVKPAMSEPVGFQPSTRELLADAATDFFFWTAGILLAVLVGLLASSAPLDPSVFPFEQPAPTPVEYNSASPWLKSAIYVAVIVFLMLLFLLRKRWRYYTSEKTAFDRSRLPFYFRLPNFHGKFVDNTDIQVINDFLSDNPKHRHLLISGPFESGRTTLAAGIGCRLTTSEGLSQLSVKLINKVSASHDRKLVRYLTASKLFEQIHEFEQVIPEHRSRRQGFWLIREAEILIIDDVLLSEFPKDQVQVPRKRIYDDIGTPVPERRSFPNAFKALDNKPIVWVVSDSNQIEDWRDWVNNNFNASVYVDTIKLADADRVFEPQEFGLTTLPGILAAVTLLASLVITLGSLLVILQADRLGAFMFWALLIGAIAGIMYAIYRQRGNTE